MIVALWAIMLPVGVFARQQEDIYTIQLLPAGENGSAVDQKNFPETRIRFFILQNGKPMNEQWEGGTFRLMEDDREVKFNMKVDQEPFDTTIVYHFISHLDIAPADPHREFLKDIVANLDQKIHLRSLCVTMVSDENTEPCSLLNIGVASASKEGVQSVLLDKFDRLTDFSKTTVVNSIRLVSYQLIWDTLMTQRVPGRPTLVLWILDDDIPTHDQPKENLLPLDEGQLARLRNAGISLAFLDLTPSDELQENARWSSVLKASGVPHLTRIGLNYDIVNSPNCTIWECLEGFMKRERPMVYSLSYNSNLFADSTQHSLRVQLLPSADGAAGSDASVLAQERSDFTISPPYHPEQSGLRPEVRVFSKLFNIIALVALIAVLVLIKRPQDDSV
ncbi:MAG: hypothetical protein RKP73_03330 [Candidatus Contendobacter sp.]|nr:hypothetical protein [Candidatus Contendobacter sp.]